MFVELWFSNKVNFEGTCIAYPKGKDRSEFKDFFEVQGNNSIRLGLFYMKGLFYLYSSKNEC